MCGILYKRGAVNTSYRDRYFILEEGRLFYFKNSKALQAISYIDIEHSYIRNMGGDLTFDIVTPGRTYYLSAPDFENKMQWLLALELYSKVARDNRLIANAEEQIKAQEQSTSEKNLVLQCDLVPVSASSEDMMAMQDETPPTPMSVDSLIDMRYLADLSNSPASLGVVKSLERFE